MGSFRCVRRVCVFADLVGGVLPVSGAGCSSSWDRLVVWGLVACANVCSSFVLARLTKNVLTQLVKLRKLLTICGQISPRVPASAAGDEISTSVARRARCRCWSWEPVSGGNWVAFWSCRGPLMVAHDRFAGGPLFGSREFLKSRFELLLDWPLAKLLRSTVLRRFWGGKLCPLFLRFP